MSLLSTARAHITQIVHARLAQSTLTMAVGMGLRLLTQTLSFVIISRFLGAAEFGAFVSVTALVAVVAAFSGWGADLLILRRVARSLSEFDQAWGNGLMFWAASAPPLALLAVLMVPVFTMALIPRELVIYVAIADVIFAPIVNIGICCYRAVDRPIGAAFLYAGAPTTRLVGALLWAAVGRHDAQSWAVYYCVASAVFAVASLLLVCHNLGTPVWKGRWNEWRDGFQFSLLTASGIVFNSVTIPTVALLSDLPTAGVYGAAVRVVQPAVVPLYAFLFSVMPHFFRSGDSGMQESLKLAVRMLPAVLAMTLLGSVCIFLVAPVVPRLLGAGYAGTSDTIKLLAALPVLAGFYFLAADALVTSHRVWLRTLLQCCMPIINAAFCVVMVPRFGAVGAAIAVLVTSVILASAGWLLVILMAHRDSRLPQRHSAP